MSIVVHCPENLPKWVRNVHKHFARWLEKTYPIEHRIDVALNTSVERKLSDGVRYVGYFLPVGKRKADIVLNCGWQEFFREDKKYRFIYHIGIFAHEFVHYEKYRDGRRQNHRGLQNRAKAITLRYFNECLAQSQDSPKGD